jgi:uncharacterized membrane protein
MIRTALLVVWNLRVLGLFLIGPAVGIAVGGIIFGLPVDIRWMAVAMFLLSLSLFGVLARGEWRRVSRQMGEAR